MNQKQQTLRESITDSIWSIFSLSESLSESQFSHNGYQLTTVTDMIQTQTETAQLHPDRTTSTTPSIKSNQPSSIISYTLSTLQKSNQNQPGEESKFSHELENINCKSDEETLLQFIGTRCADNDACHTHASFRCNIYFPTYFTKLRQQLYETNNDVESDFIQSLSACSECDICGGKKGTFCNTLDDKYLLKFTKPDEFKMFLNNFASYYDHMSNTLYNKMASLLVPIIGAYGISYSESVPMRYVLVMPNLFFSSNTHKLEKFDLKGTVNTNRYINDKYDVKLDKNYIEYIRDSPVALNRRSKNYLRDAIDNNTQFLAESNIMDYSLLIGIDSETNKIIGGIIDYFETYSWKKRAEKTFKSLFITDSTIQKPSIYKQRFEKSILNKYFVSVQC